MFVLAMTDLPHKNARYPLYLFEWRKHRSLTSQTLAAAAGIQQSLLSGLETGSRRANLDQLVSLAYALGIEPASLFRSPDDDFFKFEDLYRRLPPSRREQALQILSTFLDQ